MLDETDASAAPAQEEGTAAAELLAGTRDSNSALEAASSAGALADGGGAGGGTGGGC